MRFHRLMICVGMAVGLLTARGDVGADQYGLSTGTPELQSAGPIAFGPDGVLFVADTKAAAVYAIRVEGQTSHSGDKGTTATINIEGLNVKLAQRLGAASDSLSVTDLAVNPQSGVVYLAVMAGRDPALVRVAPDSTLSEVPLEGIPFAKVELPSPPADVLTGTGNRQRNPRSEAVTDLTFFEGQLILSGLTNQGPGSSVMSVAFPFSEFSPPAALEIYHGAHGKFEDAAAPQTFVPFMIEGEPHLLAGYVCTPLVKFPLDDLRSGEKVRGTTVAELGNHNRPLDMVSYEKDGSSYLLLANSARGVMKISTGDIAREEGITSPVRGGGTAGQPYDTIASLEGTVQLDRLSDTQAVVIIQNEGGNLDLKTVAFP